ncbi:oligosaccharide flippase family protein [Bacillus sp. DJP31]|uniref:oligosaccharide flippase family protein n=1 Tax=Bacillus sp. DJP31 TaxID=3409789 RepID=UPI003BB619B0
MQKSLVKNVLYKVLLNMFNLVLPILVGPYVNRMLGADSIGKVQFVESIYAYFFIFACFGVYQYGLREMSRIRDNKDKVNQLFTSLFIISLVTSITTLFIFLSISFLGYGDNVIFPILLIFSFNFIINIFYVEWVNEAMENYDFITFKTIIVRSIYVILIFIFVNSAEDYSEYAILLIVATFLNNIISFFYIKRTVKFNFKNLRIVRHLRPLFIVVIFSNANVLYTLLDRFMLGEYYSAKYVSYYVIPQQIVGIIGALLLSIVQVTIPRLSYLLHANDDESYVALLNKTSKIYFAFLFPASIGMYVLSDFAIYIYGGNDFIDAIPVLNVFSFYMILLGIDSILANQIIYVKKRENILVRLMFLCGFINLIFNIILLQLDILTPTNAILTTTLAHLILILTEYAYIRIGLKVNFKLFELSKMKYLIYAILFIPLSVIVREFISNPILVVILIISSCSILYGFILFLTKDEVLVMTIDKIKRKLGK